MGESLGLCRGSARRERSSSSASLTTETKFGKWQRSHNSVFMCCGFIFVFFAVVTTVSYSLEPSILTGDDEVWGHRTDLSNIPGQSLSAVQNSRIHARVLSSTALELQQEVVGNTGHDGQSTLEAGPIHFDDSNPLGLAAGLKIFVYDLPSKYNSDWLNDSRCSNHLFAAEVALHQVLLDSPLRTLDPEAADFFFVPVYVSCNFSAKNGFPALGHAKKMLRSAVDLISREMVYWRRNGGSDHVFVATHDYGTCFHAVEKLALDAGVPDFLRRSIILQTFGKKGGHLCQAVENVQIPPYVSPQSVEKYWAPVEQQERKIWAYFRGKMELHPKNASGHLYSKGIRTKLWQKFKKNPRFFLQRKRGEDYQTELLNSKFCLAPLGWAPWSPRIVEAVVYGCIPVIIADDIALPYSHIIDWASISLTVAERDVDKLDLILRHVAATNLTAMQQNLWKEDNRLALLYNQPLIQGDASWQTFNLLAQKKLHRSQDFKDGGNLMENVSSANLPNLLQFNLNIDYNTES